MNSPRIRVFVDPAGPTKKQCYIVGTLTDLHLHPYVDGSGKKFNEVYDITKLNGVVGYYIGERWGQEEWVHVLPCDQVWDKGTPMALLALWNTPEPLTSMERKVLACWLEDTVNEVPTVKLDEHTDDIAEHERVSNYLSGLGYMQGIEPVLPIAHSVTGNNADDYAEERQQDFWAAVKAYHASLTGVRRAGGCKRTSAEVVGGTPTSDTVSPPQSPPPTRKARVDSSTDKTPKHHAE